MFIQQRLKCHFLPSFLCILPISKFDIFLTAHTIKESTVSSVSVNPLSSAVNKNSEETVLKDQNHDRYVEGHSGCIKQNTSGHTQLNSLCEEEAGGKMPIRNGIIFYIRVENCIPNIYLVWKCVKRTFFFLGSCLYRVQSSVVPEAPAPSGATLSGRLRSDDPRPLSPTAKSNVESSSGLSTPTHFTYNHQSYKPDQELSTKVKE